MRVLKHCNLQIRKEIGYLMNLFITGRHLVCKIEIVAFIICSTLLACGYNSKSLDKSMADTTLSARTTEINLSALFSDIDGPGTFVLLNAKTGQSLYYNPERAQQRFIPASTFKIPNSLIALETGVASGADFALPWDSTAVPPKTWWPKSWRQDQTLRSAF